MNKIKSCILALCMCILTMSNASAYEYSVTVVDDYTYLDDLTPHGQNQYERVEYWLHDVAG